MFDIRDIKVQNRQDHIYVRFRSGPNQLTGAPELLFEQNTEVFPCSTSHMEKVYISMQILPGHTKSEIGDMTPEVGDVTKSD